MVVVLSGTTQAGDWPSWRGPGFDGAVGGTPLADGEAFALEVAWRRELGSGYSAVVVSGETAVTMFSDQADDFVIALDAGTGAERWRHRLGPTYGGHEGSEDGPSGTPTIAGDRVLALGPRGQLVALALDSGKLAWQIDIAERFAPQEPRFGFTVPPLAVDDLVVVSVGAVDGKTFVAFDAASGEVRWTVGDDTVSYETPILTTLGGRRQIVGISNHRLHGIVPGTGELLWSFEYHPGRPFGTSQVVPLGEDRLLVQDGRETVLYRFVAADADPPLEQLWRESVLGSGLSVPVVSGEQLYGFAGSLLSAVRLADGEPLWKSRPPGGTGLVLADGHLITLGKGGDLVVVRASPEGYEEVVRVNALDDPGVTYPTLAADRIYVRNTKEIAAVRIVDAPAGSAASKPAPPVDAFEAKLRRAAAADDPRAAVRELMRGQTQFPIVIGERAHFVYWGPAEDVAIAGTMTAGGDEDGMQRVPGTDLFHRSYEIPAGGRAEYYLIVDYEKMQPDPLNPRRRPFPDWWYEFEVSELVMPGYEAPTWSGNEIEPDDAGSLEVFPWTRPGLDLTRTLGVYLPAGYDAGEQRYPLAVFLHGDVWRTRGALPRLLDRAIAAGELPPLVAVFVGRAEGLTWQEMSGEQERVDFERSLADEIVPMLAERYRIDPTPASRAVVGRMDGTRPAVETALDRGDVFGHAVLIGTEWPPGIDRKVLARAEGVPAERRPKIRVVWSAGERAAENRALLEGLAGLGFEVEGGPERDASGWWAWNLQAVAGLAAAFSTPP